MARSTRSAVTERACHQFAPATAGWLPGTADEFDESDIWGSFSPVDQVDHHQQQQKASRTAELPRVPAAARQGRKTNTKTAVDRVSSGGAAHGSLPVNIPDWSKILGNEYRGHQAAGDWELDDVDDEEYMEGAPVVPPHELAWRRRAASLSVHDGMGIGKTLKVRDAVWKKTGFPA